MSGKTDVNFVENHKDESDARPEQIVLKATRSITTLLAHVMVGIIVSVSFLFALRNPPPYSITMQHIMLCVVGYQLLMIEAVLALAPDSWLSTLKLRHRKLVHWVMQILGSALALAGCFIKILNQQTHWTTYHGTFALASMVFTSVSLVNGLSSLYAYELRRVMPGILSKLTHICFGVVAILTANVSLIYGFDKGSFRRWATPRLTDTLIIILSILTVIIVINPFITFYSRLRGVIKK